MLLLSVRPDGGLFLIVQAGLLTRGSLPSVSPSRITPVAYETAAHRSQLRGQSRFADPGLGRLHPCSLFIRCFTFMKHQNQHIIT